MGDSREDSPDWLRSFQAPTQSITALSSDSEVLGDKSSLGDYSEEDEKISGFKLSGKTTKRRVEVVDQAPAKRRKTMKDKEGSENENNDEKGGIHDQSPRAANHSVWALSSDSESDIKAAVRQEVSEEGSIHILSDVMSKEAINDVEVAAPKTVSKGKSPKKQPKVANAKPKEKKTTNKLVKVDDAARKEKEATEELHAHELSEVIKGDEKNNDNEDSESKVAIKKKSPRKRMKGEDIQPREDIKAQGPLELDEDVGDMDVADEGLPEKHVESRVSSSTLPLVLPEKVSRTKALLECEGESIDLSGDMGAVGRVIIPETPAGEREMLLDLKGTIYKTTIVPSRTFCVVSVGQSEAKIEAIINDFIQLKPQSNVYDAETMVEGTLEGFSFDSEDEHDKTIKDVKDDQNEASEEPTGKKPRGKADKKSGAAQKKGKAAGARQPKKRKPQATKKSKPKK